MIKEKEEEQIINLTDDELDALLKQVMRDEGYTKFINKDGEVEYL